MAKESVALLKNKIDVALVIDQLNAALSEEWMAYYQYWTYAQVIVGPQRYVIQGEFEKHADEELQHAKWICDRIIELDGVPVLTPQQWYEKAMCVYEAPTHFDAKYLVKEVEIAEQCAMRRYATIADLTEGKDYITNDLAKKILAEEADHEQDMADFLADMKTLKDLMHDK